MMPTGRFALGRGVAAALVVCAVSARAGADPHDEHAHHRDALSAWDYARSERHISVPDVLLLNSDGRHVRFRALLDTDKPVVLNFIYTSCTTICPVMTATFAQAQNRLGVDDGNVLMISISIDPENDTPGRLRDHARGFKASTRWHFLTGDRGEIIAVLRQFDAWRGNKANHVPLTFLRAKKSSAWVRLDGLTSATQLTSEVARLSAP